MAPGSTLGRYELGETIGQGGVARVVRARVRGAGGFAKEVVIKQIRDDLRDDADVRAAFAREAALAQRLGHGNIVQTLDVGDDDGAPYLVLELVDGCTLQAVLDDCGEARPPRPLALYVVEQIAAALHYVHEARDADGHPLGLVHRDVTPANILLGKDGVVKLADFGIARSAAMGSDTLPGFIKGTVQYLAPEQAAGRPVDRRVDVYALGLVLRRMLVGDADTGGLEPELRAIVEEATEPAVRDRTASASALLDAVAAFRVAAKLGDGAAAVRDAVARRRGERVARTLALGGALGGSIRATRQVAPAIASPASSSSVPRIAGIVLAIAAVGAAWWWWSRADGASGSGEVAAATSDREAAPPRVEDRPAPEDVAPSTTTTTAEPPTRADVPALVDAPVDPPVDARVDARPEAPLDPKVRAKSRLLVNVVPYAEVTVDGRPFGRTPIDREVRAGKHTVELYNPETGRRATKRVTTHPDEPLRITAW